MLNLCFQSTVMDAGYLQKWVDGELVSMEVKSVRVISQLPQQTVPIQRNVGDSE